MENNYNLLKKWAYKWAIDINNGIRTYSGFMEEINKINPEYNKTIDCILLWAFLAYDEYLKGNMPKEKSINQLNEVYNLMKEGRYLN